MLNVTLNRDDSIETVLPTVELAMQTGDVCRIRNINYLGHIHLAALSLLAMSESCTTRASSTIVRTGPRVVPRRTGKLLLTNIPRSFA